MVSGKITISSATGLHLRPAGILCNQAVKYPCKIELVKENKIVNAKSILGVLSACIHYQDEIELVCDGEQEIEAFYDLSELLRSDFTEYDKK